MENKIAILGGGSFGTAVAHHLARKYRQNTKFSVVLYARKKEIAEEINNLHKNSKYTGDHELSPNLLAVDDLSRAVDKASYIIMGIPAQSTRNICHSIIPYISSPVTVVNLAKGLEIGTFKRMSQVICEELKTPFSTTVASLGGPAFAHDILANDPIGVTLGGNSTKELQKLRELFDTPTFDVKITNDRIGVELGGALKNVFGIMAGMMNGLTMGRSINGDFLTRSIVDMKAIAIYMGAKRATLDGRAGLGDLAITCTKHSRNFRFGREFVKVYQEMHSDKVETQAIIDETLNRLGCNTVEGYFTLKPLYEFCEERNMFVPIVRNLYKVLYGVRSPEKAIHNYRIRDKIRQREQRLMISRLFYFLFPRLWYRRERGFFAEFLNKREQKAIENRQI